MHMNSELAFVLPFLILVGSFYALQILGHVGSRFFGAWGECGATSTSFLISSSLYFFNWGSITILGTNLLVHRYLLERAGAMSKVYVFFAPFLLQSCCGAEVLVN